MKKNAGKPKKRKERGITLIALVITIVVLIILATVSINAVFSENGIIKQAQRASEMQANATAKEAEEMNAMIKQLGSSNGTVGIGTVPVPEPDIDYGELELYVDSVIFNNWVDALDEADFSGEPIILTKSCILDEDLTIPEEVTLVIPYDSTLSTKTTDYDRKGTPGGEAYTVLKCKEGVTLTVNGTLIVNAKVQGCGIAEEGVQTGTYGQMIMNGRMQVNGTVYARGYITGTGNVQVSAGGTVYQLYQSLDWSSKIHIDSSKGTEYSDAGNGGFPNSTYQKVYWTKNYYYQNIMIPTTYAYGSTLYVQYFYSSHSTLGFYNVRDGNIKMIGSSESFYAMNEGSEIIMSYDSNRDKQIIKTKGNITMANQLTFSFKGSVSTYTVDIVGGNYPHPINGNTEIEIENGTLTVANDIEMLPGSSITVESGAKIEIAEGADIYLWDVEDFKTNYVYTGNDENGEGYWRRTLYGEIMGDKAGRTMKETESAKIIVKGELNAIGNIWNSTNGENVTIESGGIGNTTLVKGEEGTSTIKEVEDADEDKVVEVTFKGFAISY